ncbi:MAG: hypothetical protein ACM3II_11685 [Rhodospirillaceae bacterium]
MNNLSTFALLAAAVGLVSTGAHAQTPVAVVEDVTGSPDVELMDYVSEGKTIKLGAADSIVLSYIKSCWRETIKGGTVAVGAEQSAVDGGTVAREKVACDGGKMELAAAQSKQAAAMVFRGTGHTPPPKPQFVIYARSPVIELAGGGALSIERVDKPGEKLDLSIASADLVHGEFYDMAKAGKALSAGAVYRAKAGNQQVVFQVDPGAKGDSGPLVGRLVRFQAPH